ncbi:xanthosine phosphorylase [Yersinia intermedia]|uniref:xanthosine phosphorylase n=1 Tax=Yersinia intermedia TaxID=631 RepID=UPI0005EA4788|nr:xanthosine phosphorylase [Yersinia intermedia]MCB5297131.1 xanthosine phosphorylase [Yersinia intermedia]CNJ01918.1 purine nucleoside phosphorylase [Yersinia intermedia]
MTTVNSNSNAGFSELPFQAAAYIQKIKPGFKPQAAFILGSGLGDLVAQITNETTLSYADIPGFPVSSVHGHAGELVLGDLFGVPVMCMKGRGHFYEGQGMSIMTNPVRTFKLMGCEFLFCTNAAGSLRPEVLPGSVVMLKDHINTMPGTPLVGPNDDRFGPRFFSLANAYDKGLRADMAKIAQQLDIPLSEGVFVSYPGPCFETPAEIRMMQIIGGDVVGMSVVPEVLSAAHCGLKVIALTAITNLAEGLSDVVLSHEQTLKCAKLASVNFTKLIEAFLKSKASAAR